MDDSHKHNTEKSHTQNNTYFSVSSIYIKFKLKQKQSVALQLNLSNIKKDEGLMTRRWYKGAFVLLRILDASYMNVFIL